MPEVAGLQTRSAPRPPPPGAPRLLLIGPAPHCERFLADSAPALAGFALTQCHDPDLDGPAAIEAVLHQMQPQVVLAVAVASLPSLMLYALLNYCEQCDVALYAVPDRLPDDIRTAEVRLASELLVLELRDTRRQPGYLAAKRWFDIVLATVVLVMGLPVWLLIALLVKLGDGGPVFYVQHRAGKHGKPFAMLKFRSMVADAETRLYELIGDVDKLVEPVVTIAGDPRVTRVGRILRRTSLDEVPQLINVLAGQMSLVGPRPEWVTLVARYSPWQRRRLKVTPGITGLQQVECRREPSLARRVRIDLRYIWHQSWSLDMKILLRTVPVIIRGRGTD